MNRLNRKITVMRVDKMHQKSIKVPETSELHDVYTGQYITVTFLWWVSFFFFLFFFFWGGGGQEG